MGQVTTKPTPKDWPARWAGVRERLRKELGDPVFDAWIAPLTLESWEKDELKLGATKPFVRNWVATHYVARIERAFRAEGCEPSSLSVIVNVPASAPAVAAGVSKEPVQIPTPAPSILSLIHI